MLTKRFMEHKKAAYEFCSSFVEEKLTRIQKRINSIKESLNSETKSSAGDKHETGRAMLQLEREKLGQQLAEVESTKRTLQKVKIESPVDKVALGSFVRTSTANFYLSISAGEYKNDSVSVFCVSINTPIGQALLGKSIGEAIVFNGNTVTILEIH